MRGRVVCSLVVLIMFLTVQVKASLNTGATAVDFSLTDINGNTHSLSQMLAEGKKVIVNFGASWSPSSWKYAYSQTLNDINTLYGEEGLDNLVILYVESDINTSEACIKGGETCNSSSMGDWTEMLNYPIINISEEDADLLGLYQVDKYPTIYGIGGDWTITNLGQTNHAKIMNWLFGEKSLHASVQTTKNSKNEFSSTSLNFEYQGKISFHGSKAAVSTVGLNATSYYSNLLSEVQNEVAKDKIADKANLDKTSSSELHKAVSEIKLHCLFT